jgi:hypothetical protein
MRNAFLLLVLTCLSVNAQALLPIPAVPSTPTLPLAINTNGYFVFSWRPDWTGRQSAIMTTTPPVEVRSGVVKVGAWNQGTWFLKTNGEVFLYSGQGGAGSENARVTLPDFFKTNVAKFFLQNSADPLLIGISSSGQMGTMFNTNSDTFSLLANATNVVDVFSTYVGGSGGHGLLTLHSDGRIKAWDISGTNIFSIAHVANQLENVKSLDVSFSCGLAITGGGQVLGWNSLNQLLPIPYSASSGVVQVSSPHSDAGDALFFALKNDGKIIYWDLQGSQCLLPSGFSEKQFVQVRGSTMGRAFALTRQGELVGWRRLGDGTLEAISLPVALSSGIKQITLNLNSIFMPQLVALTETGGILSVSELGGSAGWGIDTSVPAGIATRGGTLDSIVLGSTGGATGPSHYSLSSDGDLAAETYAGLPLDILAKLVADRILSISNNFGLATKTDVGGAVSQGVQQVLSAPSDYNLFTTQQVQSERTAGQNDVLSNPNQWTLYTTNQIKAMVMGDLMLTRTNNGQFVLNYDIEQSDDLTSWSPYQGFTLPLTNLPTDKAFVRIKLKNQQ